MKTFPYPEQVSQACQYLRQQVDALPGIALILGSGLGSVADELEDAKAIPFADIPHFPVSTVSGHAGRLIFAKMSDKEVLVMQGRVHYYEGYSMQEVTFPVRVMQELGIQKLLVTNACGGLREGMQPGDLCLIRDHVNLMGANPLRGANHEAWGRRFPDMSRAYSAALRELAKRVAARLDIPIAEAVFAAVSGPCYETHAEAHYMKTIGVDLVGMSTVPEVLVAVHAGMEVLGISSITDVLALQGAEPITHEQVVEVSKLIQPRLLKLIRGLVEQL